MQKQTILKKDIIMIVLMGVIGVFVNQWSFFVDLETADPTTAALILALTPIVAALLAFIFLGEKITLRMIFGSLIAIVGIFYVVTKGSLKTVEVDQGLAWIVLTMVNLP